MQCPICSANVTELEINRHLDSNCRAPAAALQGTSSATRPGFFIKKRETSKAVSSIFNVGKRPAEPLLTEDSHGSSLPNLRPAKRPKTSPASINLAPLAERLRPTDLSEFVGQEHLTGADSLLMHLLQGAKGSTGSMILWGPSGCGKTTLARLLAKRTDAVLKELSATNSGTNEVRAVFEEAKGLLSLTGRLVAQHINPLLFIVIDTFIDCVDEPFCFWMRYIVSIGRNRLVLTPNVLMLKTS